MASEQYVSLEVQGKVGSALKVAEHAVAAFAVVHFTHKLFTKGFRATVSKPLFNFITSLPGVKGLVERTLAAEAATAVSGMFKPEESADKQAAISIPAEGIDKELILQELRALKKGEIHAEEGRCFAYVYSLSEEHASFLKETHGMFMEENALSAMAFPALRKFENEVVSMTSSLLHGGSSACGSMTSGGTESIIMAIKTYRDYSRDKHPRITEPEIIMSETAHPAFDKACQYLGVKAIHVPMNRETMKVDLKAMEDAITPNTILLVGSAPQYPHGIVDPIEEICALAKKFAARRAGNDPIPVHVDCAIGGYMLPWVEKLGYAVPLFDFRVDGVTSISLDTHKYGFAAKGASVILYRTRSLRKYQYFAYSLWPGGLFASPSMMGTRPGGTIAAAWATMKSIGENGYLGIFKTLMETAKYMQEGVKSIPELMLVGQAPGTVWSFKSRDESKLNIFSVADVMATRGWKIEAQHLPNSIHVTTMPPHTQVREQFVEDLKYAVEEVKKDPSKYASKDTAAMYGQMAAIPSNETVDSFAKNFLDQVYSM